MNKTTMTVPEIAHFITSTPNWTGLSPREMVEAGRWSSHPETVAQSLLSERLLSLDGTALRDSYGDLPFLDSDDRLTDDGDDAYLAWIAAIKTAVGEVVASWEK